MGFTGGEESLAKMAVTAERLRINIDSIFDVAEKARTIEGAMDMAAELQLAGGSFAAINPMDLLAAARKGPKEMGDILTKMGGDIGAWVEDKNGNPEFQFDPVDSDRLRMVAKSTGMELDDLTKMIQKNAEDNRKADFMPDMQLKEVLGPDGNPLDKDMMNNMLLDAVDVNGKALKGGLLDEMGVKSLEDMTADQANMFIEKKVADLKTIEEQAKANQSFQDSVTAFTDSILNLFTIFEPFISVLTWFIQGINKMPIWGKAIVGGFVAAFTLFGTSVGAFITQGIGSFAKSVASFGKSAFDFVKNMASSDTWKSAGSSITDKLKGAFTKGGKDPISDGLKKGGDIAGDKSMSTKGGKEKAGFLQGLSKGIQSFGKVKMKDLLKFAASLAIIGGAIVGFTYALASAGGEASMAQWVNAGAALILLGGSVYLMSKVFGSIDMGNLVKGALAMVLVGASLIPFAFAAQMLTDVDWMSVLAGIGIMALVVLGLMGLGALLMGPQILFLLVGVATLIAVGASLLIASIGLLAAGEAFEKLSGINWDGFSGMGTALLSIIPGLLAFSLASMMFLNPLTILGIIAMTGTLGALAMVMVPLASSLDLGANGLDRFANGLEKLQKAANNLDFEKLESLRDLSTSLAVGSVGGGVMGDTVDKIAEAILKLSSTGGGGGKGGTQKIQIDLKLNGRDLQQIIVDDTSIVT